MWAWALWALPLLCPGGRAALPAKPENISCIFYYRKNFTCTWSPEKEASHTWYRVRRTYSYGHKNDTCNSTSETPASCSFFSPITTPDIYTIQVEALNADGAVASDVTHWYLPNIVKIEPPVISSVTPVWGVKGMLQIKWATPELTPVSSMLKCRLRFRIANSTHWMEVSFEEGAKLYCSYNLTGLQASTEYEVALRCAARESAFWSGWSPVHSGATEEEALLGLDLWRVLGPAREDGSRLVRLLWKARGGPALGYHVWFFPENTTNRTESVNTTRPQLELTLGAEAYRVLVVPYNSLGRGPAATLRIPAAAEEGSISFSFHWRFLRGIRLVDSARPGPRPAAGRVRRATWEGGQWPVEQRLLGSQPRVRPEAFRGIEAVQARLAQDRLVVAWQSSAPHVDSWMVEWLPDLDSEPPTLSWEAVTGARNWTIRQDELTPLQCYNISVYPVWQDRVGRPCSVQAYAKEGVPSVGPVTKAEGIGVKTVTVTWEEIPKHQRNGFIRNYTIFYQAEGGEAFAKTVGASTLRCGLESLRRKTSYSVWVMASTSAGGFNGTRINFKTLSISVLEICLVAALGSGGLLILSVLAAACGLQKPKLKHLCWPDIPNPAESSLAAWRSGDLKDKLNLKEADDAMSAEDRILKPFAAPSDLIDKLAVNIESFLEEVSAEEAGKGQEDILGGDKNEYVASPFRPYCLLEPLPAAEALPTAAEAPPTAVGGPPTLAQVPPTASKASPTVAEVPPLAAKAPPTVAEAPPREPQHLCSGSQEGTSPEAEEQLVPSAQRPGPASTCACAEGAPNLYLKNSVTTREFLVSEDLPDQTKRAT